MHVETAERELELTSISTAIEDDDVAPESPGSEPWFEFEFLPTTAAEPKQAC